MALDNRNPLHPSKEIKSCSPGSGGGPKQEFNLWLRSVCVCFVLFFFSQERRKQIKGRIPDLRIVDSCCCIKWDPYGRRKTVSDSMEQMDFVLSSEKKGLHLYSWNILELKEARFIFTITICYFRLVFLTITRNRQEILREISIQMQKLCAIHPIGHTDFLK